MKWEYKTINIAPALLRLTNKSVLASFKPELDEQLTTLGENGWELVSVAPYDVGCKFILIFKRPKTE